jgi:hypothetical protein
LTVTCYIGIETEERKKWYIFSSLWLLLWFCHFCRHGPSRNSRRKEWKPPLCGVWFFFSFKLSSSSAQISKAKISPALPPFHVLLVVVVCDWRIEAKIELLFRRLTYSIFSLRNSKKKTN